MHPLLESAEALKNLLVARATGTDGDEAEYMRLRQMMIEDPWLSKLIPRFVRTCRDLPQFWQFIKHKFPTYAERRTYLWKEFEPLMDALETEAAPSDGLVSAAVEKFDSAHVQSAWSKALERRASDPEGAITMARTLLESICKHILEEGGAATDDAPDISKLYRQTAERLQLAPSQHTGQVFKQILGGCTAVVEGLGALRNRLSDAHGTGKVAVKPAPRHAELAVNLAGALAVYLLATKSARDESSN
ncbi:abortive infection family protein [Scleromatobacter humisilvae]|uniref:Abortive infection family protein n=1 Tax=Scleromatobacter humisilvae TaxID=2897159 RepID=A0A9X2C3D1_9BURK|nr:abortive infection family protein [Scleromatobacter humisilvae]MCK9687275.1 abortive infection family protein [Scleromatobacter humisilvae]